MRKDSGNSRVFHESVEEERSGGRKQPLKSVLRVVFTKEEEKKAESPGLESARRGSRRLWGCRRWGLAAAILWSSASASHAEPMCRPPVDLKVFQDAYSNPLGRVYLIWTNQGSYFAHCISVDGNLHAEVPGIASVACISGVPSGTHEFSIRSTCLGSTPSEPISASLEILDQSPQVDPVRSMSCSFRPDVPGLTVELTGLAARFQAVDIFVQTREGSPEFLDCRPLDGSENATLTLDQVDDDSTHVFLQFFDELGHGSVMVECPAPVVHPPKSLQVFQTSYGQTAGVVLCWIRDGGQKGFEVLVDGTPSITGALMDTHFVNGLETEIEHRFEVRTIPWTGTPGQGATAKVTPRSTTPNPDPVRSIRTVFRPVAAMECGAVQKGTLHVSWEPKNPENSGIFSVDFFLQRGPHPLRYVTTVDGALTDFELDDVFEDDGVALQFFDEGLFGSPVFGGSFRRGDPNASGAVDISDAVMVLNFLFSGGVTIDCLDAADANDSGELDISDGMFILNFLFGGTRAPDTPGHLLCGLDMTEDKLPPCRGVCAEAGT